VGGSAGSFRCKLCCFRCKQRDWVGEVTALNILRKIREFGLGWESHARKGERCHARKGSDSLYMVEEVTFGNHPEGSESQRCHLDSNLTGF